MQREPRVWTVLLAIIFVSSCITHFATASIQKVIFYKDADCKNDSMEFTESNENLASLWVTDALSMHIVGIWKIKIKSGNSIIPVINDNTNAPDGRCVNKTEWTQFDWENVKINGVERLGPDDTAISQIIFFPLKGFAEKAAFAANGDMKTTSATTIQSYLHFSNDSWTIYPEKEFQGKPIYLRPTDVELIRNENGTVIGIKYPNQHCFTYKSSALIYVGSVKKGIIEYEYSSGMKIAVSSAFLLIVMSIVTLMT